MQSADAVRRSDDVSSRRSPSWRSSHGCRQAAARQPHGEQQIKGGASGCRQLSIVQWRVGLVAWHCSGAGAGGCSAARRRAHGCRVDGHVACGRCARRACLCRGKFGPALEAVSTQLAHSVGWTSSSAPFLLLVPSPLVAAGRGSRGRRCGLFAVCGRE